MHKKKNDRKLSINCQRDDIHAFSKHSPARARAPDIRIAHTSVADHRCDVCCAFVTRDTHTHALCRANDDYCRCINVMCSITMETSANKNFTVSAQLTVMRSCNIIYLNIIHLERVLNGKSVECNIYTRRNCFAEASKNLAGYRSENNFVGHEKDYVERLNTFDNLLQKF